MAREQQSRGTTGNAPAEQPILATKTKYVQYVGLSDNRGITRADFAAHGVDHDSLWWTKQNKWRVPLSKISDEAYQIAMERDPEFVLVEADD